MMGDRYGHSHWGMHGEMGAGGWVLMSLLMIIGIAVIISVTYALLHVANQRPTPLHQAVQPARSTAEATLDERFARGEIDEAEYIQRRNVLRTE